MKIITTDAFCDSPQGVMYKGGVVYDMPPASIERLAKIGQLKRCVPTDKDGEELFRSLGYVPDEQNAWYFAGVIEPAPEPTRRGRPKAATAEE